MTVEVCRGCLLTISPLETMVLRHPRTWIAPGDCQHMTKCIDSSESGAHNATQIFVSGYDDSAYCNHF